MVSQPITNSSKQLRLAIAMGDPAGIGPEVILKALADSSIKENCTLTVIGTRSLRGSLRTIAKTSYNRRK